MPTAPSYYLSKLDAKRQRSQAMRQGLGGAIDAGFQGLDVLARAQAALAQRQAAELAGKQSGAESAARVDLLKAQAEKARMSPAAKAAREPPGHSVNDAEPDADADERGEQMSSAFSMIRDDVEREKGELPVETSGDIQSSATNPEMGDTISRVMAALEMRGAAKPPVATAQPATGATPSAPKVDPLKQARLDKAQADAEMAKRKNDEEKAAGGKPMNPGDINALISKPRAAIAAVKKLKGRTRDPKVRAGAALAGLPGAGLIMSPEAKKLQSDILLTLRSVGKASEGGMMTDSDFAFYEKALFKALDNPDSFDATVQGLADKLAEEAAAREADLAGSKYMVPAPSGSGVVRREGGGAPAAIPDEAW